MTHSEIRRALAIRALLADDHATDGEITKAVLNDRQLLERVIEYYCASWLEVDTFMTALRVVTGESR